MDEFLLSLSESTIYLLGDEELISLWEDAHKRNKQLYKSDDKSKEEHMKPTYLGVATTHNEVRNKLKTISKNGTGNKYGTRSFLRDEEKFRKMNKKNGQGDSMKYWANKYVESGKAKNLKDAHNALRKESEDYHNSSKFNHNAGYDYKSNSIHVTHPLLDKLKDSNPLVKGTIEHEKQHWKDHMYLKGKYGNQRARQVQQKMSNVDYYKNPTEINAHQKGYDVRNENNSDRSKEYHKRLDNFVKSGKSNETVPEHHRDV